MDTSAFEAALKSDGYTEVETKYFDPRPANGEHGHHFAVRGLVLDGAFTLIRDGKSVTYRTGEVFAVPNASLHCEEIGSEGARVMIGRKF